MKRIFVENFCLGVIFLIIGSILQISEIYGSEVFPQYSLTILAISTIAIIVFILKWERKKENYILDEKLLVKISYILFKKIGYFFIGLLLILGWLKSIYNYQFCLSAGIFSIFLGSCFIIRYLLYVYHEKKR